MTERSKPNRIVTLPQEEWERLVKAALTPRLVPRPGCRCRRCRRNS